MKLLNLFEYDGIISGSEGFTILFKYEIDSYYYGIDFLLSEDDGCVWKYGIVETLKQNPTEHHVKKLSSKIKSKLSDDFMYQYQHDRDWKQIPKNFFDTHPGTFPDKYEMEAELKASNIYRHFIKATLEGKE